MLGPGRTRLDLLPLGVHSGRLTPVIPGSHGVFTPSSGGDSRNLTARESHGFVGLRDDVEMGQAVRRASVGVRYAALRAG